MRFIFHDQNSHALHLSRAMRHLGNEPDIGNPEVLFIDHDSTPYHKGIISAYPGAKVICYPHGEAVNVTWDGLWTPDENTKIYLSSNPGCTKVMDSYGYPNKIFTIGWFMTGVFPFRPAKPRGRTKVLFCPIHPLLGKDYMHKDHKRANMDTYDALLGMDIDLTVRYLGKLGTQGIYYHPDVKFIEGRRGEGWKDLNGIDVVVSYNKTYLAGCVALGFPVVAFGQDYAWPESYGPEDDRRAAHWNMYEDYIRFPYDISDGESVLYKAMEREPKEWKRNFIGEPFSLAVFAEALNTL